ncbi:hypothetical protein [Nitratidesulfovibrio vulgaris]|uniref:hypothetical protein n=1 Tax=Nitratidesulfovibrio vulgaris TaxID=881 RepID=UPI0013E07610|nr:hypothetical protein [Nitratidesulfovibrio vulgaris]
MTIDSFVIDGTARAVSGIAHAMTDPLFVWPLGIALGLAGVCGLMRLLQVRTARAEEFHEMRVQRVATQTEIAAHHRESIARKLLTSPLPNLVMGKVSSHCPFHSERTPGGAFFYDPVADIGVCHSCGKRGGIISILNILRGRESDDPQGADDFVSMVAEMFPSTHAIHAVRAIPLDAEGLRQFAEAVHVMSGDIIRNGCGDAARVRRFGETCAVAARLAQRNAEGV